MYREVIEHPWSIPDEIKKHLDLNNGNDRGRIYRLVPDNAGWNRRSVAPGLAAADTSELVKTLGHPNGWHRDTASRLLSERKPEGAAALLEALLRESPNELARLHALSLLHSTNLLSQETLSMELSDASPAVRSRALLLAAERLAKGPPSPAVLSAIARLASDRDARVRFECARTAVALLTPETSALLSEALLALARTDHAHPWIAPALLQRQREARGPHVLSPLLGDRHFTSGAGPFVSRLLELRAATEAASVFPELLRFALTPKPNPAHLRALGQGFARNGSSLEKADLEGLLAPVFAEASRVAGSYDAASERRLEALEVLSVAPEAAVAAYLKECLRPGQEDAFEAGAVRLLSPRAGSTLPQLLLARWAGAGSRTREGILDALLAREERTLALLEAMVRGEVPAAALSPARVQALVSSKVAAIASKARTALAEVIPPSRESVVAKYQGAAALAGDAGRGGKVYDARCQGCHRAAGRGLQVGPDLLTVKSKGREALLTAILDPNKEVASQYIVHTITTKGGEIYTGMISEDTAQAVTLLQGGVLPQNIARGDIKGSSSEGKSMMPEGLEAGLEVQSLADLLTFIETLP
jgi:putative heme-binding domain-containing protein